MPELHWWIFPLAMMALCFFICMIMMRGARGSMMCGFGPHRNDGRSTRQSDSAIDILDKRYANGEIDQREYEEKKMKLISTNRGT